MPVLDVIDRIAKAMLQVGARTGDDIPWNEMTEESRNWYRAMARAALREMMFEPEGAADARS